jgi:hypothetical protein
MQDAPDEEEGEMTQLELRTQTEFDVDGHVDAKGIRYIGKAVLMGDGTWRCLANVGGALCRVEVKITFQEKAS